MRQFTRTHARTHVHTHTHTAQAHTFIHACMQCPQCKKRALKADIRNLFVTNLICLDSATRDTYETRISELRKKCEKVIGFLYPPSSDRKFGFQFCTFVLIII